jgi:IS5 family transposase
LARAAQTVAQSGSKKSKDGAPKLYSFHAPEVSCINKGKSRQPYGFGVKVGIASTLRHNLIVGAKAFHGNPCDGHTLNAQLEQAAILMQDMAASLPLSASKGAT